MGRRRNPHYEPTSIAMPHKAWKPPRNEGITSYATDRCRTCGAVIYLTTNGSGRLVALSTDYNPHPCEDA